MFRNLIYKFDTIKIICHLCESLCTRIEGLQTSETLTEYNLSNFTLNKSNFLLPMRKEKIKQNKANNKV